jgi:hypothetical protein
VQRFHATGAGRPLSLFSRAAYFENREDGGGDFKKEEQNRACRKAAKG